MFPKFVGSKNSNKWCSIDDILNTSEPIIFKIDVEGKELEVLKGAQNIIENGDGNFIVETHSKKLEEECIRFLKRFNYKIRIINQGKYRLFIPELRPIPHNRWFVAIKEK